MKKNYLYLEDFYPLNVQKKGDHYSLSYRDAEFSVKLFRNDGQRFIFELETNTHECYVVAQGREIWVSFDGEIYQLKKAARSRTSSGTAENGERHLHAPMPGQIRDIQVAPGDEVTQGQSLLILEAMKMEIRIQAPKTGVVAAVHVALGNAVEKDQLLVELE